MLLHEATVILSFLRLNTLHCVAVPHLFIHFSINGLLGFSPLFPIMNKAAMNFDIQVYGLNIYFHVFCLDT